MALTGAPPPVRKRRGWSGAALVVALGLIVVVSVVLALIGHAPQTVVIEGPGGVAVRPPTGFDWELWALIFAGVGTTALAAATVALAWFSRSDVEAQWRPVLTVDEEFTQLPPADAANAAGQRRLILRVFNVGRGPALNITTEIVSPDWLRPTNVPRIQSFAPGAGERRFEWQFLEPKAPAIPLVTTVIRFSYSDIAGAVFETDVQVTVGADYSVASCSQTVQPRKTNRRFGRKKR